MTIRWFTDADRQDMLDAKEERRVLDELDLKYTTWTTARHEVPAERMLPTGYLQIDPKRRR